jgi:hypothetical protein
MFTAACLATLAVWSVWFLASAIVFVDGELR